MPRLPSLLHYWELEYNGEIYLFGTLRQVNKFLRHHPGYRVTMIIENY